MVFSFPRLSFAQTVGSLTTDGALLDGNLNTSVLLTGTSSWRVDFDSSVTDLFIYMKGSSADGGTSYTVTWMAGATGELFSVDEFVDPTATWEQFVIPSGAVGMKIQSHGYLYLYQVQDHEYSDPSSNLGPVILDYAYNGSDQVIAHTTYDWTYWKATFHGDGGATYGPYWWRIPATYDGTFHWTCAGSYDNEIYDANGNLLESRTIDTSMIQNGRCNSFIGDTIADPFIDMHVSKSGDVGQNVTWDPVDGATGYDIFRDGQYIGHSPASVTSYFDPNGNTSSVYEVHAIDKQNTIIASGSTDGGNQPTATGGTGGLIKKDDPIVGDHSGSGGTTGGTTCTACQQISDALQCPEWDQYMGEFQRTMTTAINNADWQKVADTMKDTMIPAMDTLLGHPDPPPPTSAPTVPTFKTDDLQRPPEPTDTTPPVTKDINFDNVQPVPVEPDTTGGIDLSPADPTENIKHQEKGYFPKPGQESGGYKPITEETPNPIPKTGGITLEPAPAPKNSGSLPPGGTPKPTTSSGTTPTPTAPAGSVTPSPSPKLPPP